MITIYKNIFSKEANYIGIDKALERIKNGKSKEQIDEIRNTLDKEKANKLKSNLPSVCFSGKFGNNRQDVDLIQHSGYIVLDFDNIKDVEFKKEDLAAKPYVKAAWVSPSGKGVKALVKIADKDKHRSHFQALKDIYPDVDPSGINVSRVCYESYDPEIVIKDTVISFTKTKDIEKVYDKVTITNNIDIFNNIFKWLSNKGEAFTSGERNIFIFKLASACCRFGIPQDECFSLCNMSFLANDSTFTNKEAELAIKSAYRSNQGLMGTASFENDQLVDKVSKREVSVTDEEIFNNGEKPTDVIYGVDVKGEALSIFDNGYESATSTFVTVLDEFYKWKKGEITLLTGIGNHGKSTFAKYLLLIQVIKNKSKIAIFTPEEIAPEFFHDLVEVYFGISCTPNNPYRPSRLQYEKVYDMISSHFFIVYPKDLSPTPEYIKEKFLELIIKENVSFCVVDPFNQMTNDYSATGNNIASYLEIVLADFCRFTQRNNVHFVIIAHPNKLHKDNTGNYSVPDVYDIQGGSMWVNKMDNILVFHQPYRSTDPSSTVCEFHSKKIRRRKIVGTIGSTQLEYVPRTRRYLFNGADPFVDILTESKEVKQLALPINHNFDLENF